MEQRVSVITLGVGDVAASAAFYERLGWRRSARWSAEEIAFFDLNGLVLGVFGRADLVKDAGVDDDGRGFRGVALGHNVATREAVDATLAEAEAAGGRILKPAQDVFWGGYAGYFADPDGHAWEIAWNPHFPLDEQGRVSLPA